MKSSFSSLLKANFNLLITNSKKPYINAFNQRISGRVLSVIFDKRSTTFEVSNYVKTSKKLRSNTTETQIRDIFQYNFIGLCIAHRKDQYILNTSFLIRNTFDRIPYELRANLYSPLIEDISVLFFIKKLVHLKHSKYYYLRKKPMPESNITFDYVTDMYDHDILQEEDINVKAIENKRLHF